MLFSKFTRLEFLWSYSPNQNPIHHKGCTRVTLRSPGLDKLVTSINISKINKHYKRLCIGTADPIAARVEL